MKFRIPLSISSVERLKKQKIIFRFLIKHKKKSKLQIYLDNTDTGFTREQYLNVCLKSFSIAFIVFFIILTTLFAIFNIKLFPIWSFLVALLISTFVFFAQLIYPKIYTARKIKNIERNLIPALENMLVQLNSGVPLYNILINISFSKYGELSVEFKKAIKEISSGRPQIQVLEEMGEKNPSIFLKRALWQITNGMKAGSDISQIIQDTVDSLNKEQLVQIQNYGNKLNPLIMFYMLITVIMPALAITFLTIISSIVNLSQGLTITLYIVFFVFVTLIQIMFLGVIRSAKPGLL